MEFKDFDDFCEVNGIPCKDILQTESFSIGVKDGYFYYKDNSMEYGQFNVYDLDGIITKVIAATS